MARLSGRIGGILGDGKNGWEVHFRAAARKAAGEDITMLSIGDHDFPSPPASVEACVRHLREGRHNYGDLAGLPRMRAAMAKVSERSTGVATTADNILATPGGQGALFAAVQASMDPGDHCLVIAPYYATYPGTVRSGGAFFTLVEARPEDGFEPTLAALQAALQPNTRALLVNSPNNPTGAVYSRRTIEDIARFAVEHDLWVISDEVYWPFAGGAHVSPLAMPGMEERTLVVNSVSKSHGMTGWRVGWLRAPRDVARRLVDFNLVSTYGLADFVSHAVADALEGEIGVKEIAALYAARRTVLLEAFSGSNLVTIRGSQGGMYVMLDMRAVESDGERFGFALLEAERIGVMPGESFGAAAAGHVRIALTQPEDVLRDAAARILRFAGSYRRERGAA
jgi:arginine:pyruvate transaminase